MRACVCVLSRRHPICRALHTIHKAGINSVCIWYVAVVMHANVTRAATNVRNKTRPALMIYFGRVRVRVPPVKEPSRQTRNRTRGFSGWVVLSTAHCELHKLGRAAGGGGGGSAFARREFSPINQRAPALRRSRCVRAWMRHRLRERERAAAAALGAEQYAARSATQLIIRAQKLIILGESLSGCALVPVCVCVYV